MSRAIETASRALGLLAVLVAALALAPTPALASSVRVPADYYGVNFQRINGLGPAVRDRQLQSLVALGIHQVRFNVSWAAIEPVAPVNGAHTYRWGDIDDQVAAMARNGVRPQATLTQTPNWDSSQNLWIYLQCGKAHSRAPLSIAPYVNFARAFAQRYGRGGAFWQQNPDLPADPVLRYEIWNEPNLKGGWCPRPQPETYAKMFVGAATAIRSIDPNAEVTTGGVAAVSPSRSGDDSYLNPDEFLARATASQPALARLASAVAVHIYPSTEPLKQLARLAWFRTQLRAGGIPNATPMLIDEVGWAAHGGAGAVGEADRADAYSSMTVNYARTNCNVAGILPHEWISAEQDPNNPDDWYGIADPATANPYASALAYSHGLRLMRGDLPQEAPTTTLMACDGMPLPDADGDGVPDENDYYPLDPARS